MTTPSPTVGDLLRDWRQRRRFSQLALAGEAAVSTRHLSFVESGRAAPSRDMLLRLAESLALPLRERNRLLLAGGYAPLHAERPLHDPDMVSSRAALEAFLKAQEPFPALAVDRHWHLVAANAAVGRLIAGVAPRLLLQPVDVLRLTLDPEGLAPRIANLADWRHHILARLRREADGSGDAILHALHAGLAALPVPAGRMPPRAASPIAVPLQIVDPASGRLLSFLSATTVFGTATDLTLAELTLESFYPADAETRAALMAEGA